MEVKTFDIYTDGKFEQIIIMEVKTFDIYTDGKFEQIIIMENVLTSIIIICSNLPSVYVSNTLMSFISDVRPGERKRPISP
jgi:hypothetical protein